jgi:hypothetical protein
LTTRYHEYIIVDKSDEVRDASSRIEMGNPNSSLREELKTVAGAQHIGHSKRLEFNEAYVEEPHHYV